MIWEPIKRWLYRGNRPGRVASWLNRGWVALQARGVGPQNLVTLEVVGHRSGRLISLPLMIASIDGERYVASMLGADAAWVRNVKAADGYAVLRHESAEKVRLEEVAVAERSPLLKSYLQQAPGARPHVPVSRDAPVEAFEAIAANFPVFRVRRVS